MVVIAQVKHPVPSRTRKLSTVAPMVLRLKAWESRSPPNLEKSSKQFQKQQITAGWSSQVARQAHNLKVVGSNPTPATNIPQNIKAPNLAPAGPSAFHQGQAPEHTPQHGTRARFRQTRPDRPRHVTPHLPGAFRKRPTSGCQVASCRSHLTPNSAHDGSTGMPATEPPSVR